MVNEGRRYFYIVGGIGLCVLLIWWITHHWYFCILSCFIFTMTILIFFFFRDPDRIVPDFVNVIVSPADGKIVSIETDQSVSFCKEKMQKLSIFLSFIDVHVNRIPFSGQVEIREYKSGRYHPAFNSVSSEANEQLLIGIKTHYGPIFIKQIAGFIARRIVCYLHPGDNVQRGERYGMIKFGSRVEIYLPLNVSLQVQVGERVRGGSYIIGEFIHGK